MFINDINARLGEIDAELEGLAALTDPTEEDAARSEELVNEGDSLRQKRIEAMERQQRIAEARAKAKEEGREIKGASFNFAPKESAYDTDVRTMDDSDLRDASRSILERPEARHLSPEQQQRVSQLVGKMDTRLAKLTIGTSRPEYRSAFTKYVSGNGDLLTNDEKRAVQEVRAAGLTDAAGGFAVPVLLDPSIIYTGDGNANPIRRVARIVTGMDDTWRGVSSAGITATWDSEAQEVGDNTPTLAQPTVTAHKANAFVPFSVEIEGDWQGMAAEMTELFQEAKDNLETTAFATGTGTDQPVGILTALFAGSSTAGVLPTTDGAFGAEDVYNVFGQLPPRYRSRASWQMSIDVMNEIRDFDTSGALGRQTVDLTADYGFPILGRPAYENSGFPDFTGTTGAANILAVGDFSNYVVFDRIGSRVEFVPHLFATGNNRPSGQRGLYFWWRVGADSVNDNAFRLLLNA
jgi:HK97 family phage major capsid protein